MMMNTRIILLVVSLFATMAVQAQQATLKVEYTNTSLRNNSDSVTVSSKMTLLSGSSMSKYYNTMSEYCDSMNSTPEGKKQLLEIQTAAWFSQSPDGSMVIDMRKGNAPRKKEYTYIFKDFQKKTYTHYDKWGMDDLGYYTEKLGDMDWQIEADSTRTILGYECLMAETDYHGRHWKAWFAPEIPVQDGPWKFRGLPGLILRAESDPAFSFEATGIETCDESIVPIYSPEEYSKVDRKKALKNYENFRKNGLNMLQASFGSPVSVGNLNDKKEIEFNRQMHALETDY